jgi:hypothetical protein
MKLTPKEQRILDHYYLEPLYSGNDSEGFWRVVNNEANDETLYAFACALQDVELRVLFLVNKGIKTIVTEKLLAERQRRKPSRRGVKRRS